MDATGFDTFSAQARQDGYDEVLVREWAPLHQTPVHEHPFDTRALVVRGEFWLTRGGQVEHLKAGDRFEVARNSPHAERYGSEGATFWAARIN